MPRVAINGFGRIGRLAARILLDRAHEGLELVAINGTGDPEQNALLLQYDSNYGPMNQEVCAVEQATGSALQIGKKTIPVTSIPNPTDLNWGEMGVDLVLECTGKFNSGPKAQAHLDAGAGLVLLSAPGDDVDRTVVYGVNHSDLRAQDLIVSNASCTTNCLAPVAKVLEETVGILRGSMSTVHAATGDQNLIDGRHDDPRRGRAAHASLVPTSTGAAKAIGQVLPALDGKLNGTAVRVPTATVSMIDLVFNSKKRTSIEEVNAAMAAAANGALKGVLAYNDRPLVSVDFKGNPASAIFDATQTAVLGDDMVRVVAWYDNEWGFAERLIDTAVAMLRLQGAARAEVRQAA